MQIPRRQFLTHLGALGLGTLFLPGLAKVVRADTIAKADFQQRYPNLLFQPVESKGLAAFSYLVADTKKGEAVVIDPRRDVADYRGMAKENSVTITHVLETHIHADFLSGARELAHQTGTAKVAVSAEGGAKYGYTPDRLLRNHDKISVGSFNLTALHTPGHTPEHMSYLLSEGSQPIALFTGDFLFVGSVGRPDLMGVENTERLAKSLFQTVQHGYQGLPDALPIFPAHGPGSPCGAGIKHSSGQPTLGVERATNPYLHLTQESTFIQTLLEAQPPVPYLLAAHERAQCDGAGDTGRHSEGSRSHSPGTSPADERQDPSGHRHPSTAGLRRRSHPRDGQHWIQSRTVYVGRLAHQP